MPQKSSTRNHKLTRKQARDLEVSIGFLEGLTRRSPDYVEALQMLGDHYTQKSDHAQSLSVDLKLSALLPRNPVVFYNLACSYSLNGDLSQAVAALDQALALGYRDFRWLARDPDLKPLRKHSLFRPIEEKIQKMKVDIA
jgi:tetratricopeptide (TPR) repeat protein